MTSLRLRTRRTCLRRQRGRCPKQAQEDLLAEVVGVGAVQEPRAQVAVHDPVVLAIDLGEGRTLLRPARGAANVYFSKSHDGVPADRLD